MTISTAGPDELTEPDIPVRAGTFLGILGEDDEAIAAQVAAQSAEAERDRLIDVLLEAAYPMHDTGQHPIRELPHRSILGLIAHAKSTGGIDVHTPHLEQRRAMAARILDALTPELAPAPDDDPEVPGQQPVAVDTLRRWAVWCDQIAEHADNRRRLATNGARHLADHIRIEIAHPLNRPDLDPANYRDASIFDADRQDPAVTEETS